MQGQKCTRIDLRACLFSKISWGYMPPDPPSLPCAYTTRISPASSKLPSSHICTPFLNLLNATPYMYCTCIIILKRGSREVVLLRAFPKHVMYMYIITIYTCIYIHMYMHIYMDMCTYMYMCMCTYTCTCMYSTCVLV